MPCDDARPHARTSSDAPPRTDPLAASLLLGLIAVGQRFAVVLSQLRAVDCLVSDVTAEATGDTLGLVTHLAAPSGLVAVAAGRLGRTLLGLGLTALPDILAVLAVGIFTPRS